MAGRELVTRKSSSLDLREISTRTTLRHFRSQGHTYVELRRVGKRSIFFCVLCQVQCFNDSVLSDHLNGNLHSKRYSAAKITLLGPNPFPFSDGVLLFTSPHWICGNGLYSASTGVEGLGLTRRVAVKWEIVEAQATFNFSCINGINGCSNANSNGRNGGSNDITNGKSSCRNGGTNGRNSKDKGLVIPGVLMGEEISNLRVKFIGFGQIGSRVLETEDGHRIPKLWCAWLGQEDSEVLKSSAKCNFAVVTFPYTYDLGRKPTADELEGIVSPGSFFEMDESGKRRKRRKKSFSDPEDSSDGINGVDTSHQVRGPGFVSSRAARRELRKQNCAVAERTCDICRRLMLPGKDVSTLLNCKTGRLACSSRNLNGAFHLFHTSCLIHWILQCEYEMWINGPAKARVTTRGRKAKLARKKDVISSVFCPECQGTGIHVEGDEFEKPTIILPKMFLYKLEAIKAHNTWMKNPEDLQKCSTGFQYEPESPEKFQGKAMLVKSLQFYRADERRLV